MKRIVSFMLALLVIAGVFASAGAVKAEAAAAKLSKKKLTLEVGESKKIKVKGTKATVVWTSSNEEVAVVKKGKITAKGEGKCDIIAAVGSKKLTCKVTVKAAKETPFDSSVKLKDIKFPAMSSWETAMDVTETEDGLTMVTYLDESSDVIRSVLYEVAELPGDTDQTLTDAEFKIFAQYMEQVFSISFGATDMSSEIIKDSGKLYGSATGTLVSNGLELPFRFCYKIEGNYLVATGAFEYSDKLSAEAARIALDACKGAKKK